jgi:6-phosphogluconate dehydrogenase
MAEADIGLVGLAVMGENLILDMESNVRKKQKRAECYTL